MYERNVPRTSSYPASLILCSNTPSSSALGISMLLPTFICLCNAHWLSLLSQVVVECFVLEFWFSLIKCCYSLSLDVLNSDKLENLKYYKWLFLLSNLSYHTVLFQTCLWCLLQGVLVAPTLLVTVVACLQSGDKLKLIHSKMLGSRNFLNYTVYTFDD